MKKITCLLILVISIFLLTTCNGILNPDANGRWNPSDPSYDSATDPDAGSVGPIVTINGSSADATPRQTKSWSWAANTAGCVYRSEVTQNADFSFVEEPFTTNDTASQDNGDGTYYLFVQARDADGKTGPTATANAVLDNTAPSALSVITTTTRFEKVNLEWTNPGGDFDHVEFRFSTGTYPATINDGTQIYSGSAESYSHTGLTSDVTYYYSAFSFDAAGNYSTATQANESADTLRIYLYVSDRDTGLRIIEATNPTDLTLLGTCDTWNARDVHIDGYFAYVADLTAGLRVIDISDPASPTVVGTCDTPGSAYGVYVQGDYAYVADTTGGLQIIDVSNPVSPVITEAIMTSSNAIKVCVQSTSVYSPDEIYAYVAVGASGIDIINVTDPQDPQAVITIATTDSAQNVYSYGVDLYVADVTGGLNIITIEYPAMSYIIGSVDSPPSSSYGVYVNENYAYVADSSVGVHIIDNSDPTSPSVEGTYNTANWAREVCAYGSYAFVADETNLYSINFSTPALPLLGDTYAATTNMESIFLGFND